MTTLLACLILAAPPLVPMAPIEVPGGPGKFDYVQVDAGKHRVIAAHTEKGQLSVLDLDSHQVQEIDTGAVNGIAIDTSTNRIFVAGAGKTVVALDRDSLQKIGEYQLDHPADSIALALPYHELYVDNDDGKEVWVFDTRALTLKATIPITGQAEWIEYDGMSDRVYQNVKDTNLTEVIDPRLHRVVAKWTTSPATSPHGMAIDNRKGWVFVAGKNGKLVATSMKTGRLAAMVNIAENVDQICYDSTLQRIYCASSLGKISVVQVTKDGLTSLGDVVSSVGAKTIAVDPLTHSVWVVYSNQKGSYFQGFTIK